METQPRNGGEAAESKDRILDAAERLFAERGFAATSMRHIAQEAGVNVATLYYHCGSKEQLFVSIYARVVERITAWVGETFETGGDFRTIVGRILDRVLAFLAEHPSVPRLLLRSDVGELPGADADKREIYRPLYDMVAQVMEKKVERGEIRKVDPRTFVAGATGVISYLALNLAKSSGGGRIDPVALASAQRHARMFILSALGLDPGLDEG